MENKYHNIDEIFRNSLENFSADPPAHVWENIDSALDKLDGKRKSRFMWFMGSFLAVTTAFVGGYYLSGYLSPDTAPVTERNAPVMETSRVNTATVQFPEEKVVTLLNEKVASRQQVPVFRPQRVVHHNPLTHTASTHTGETGDVNGNVNITNTGVHTTNANGHSTNLGNNDRTIQDRGYFSTGGGNNGRNNNVIKPVNNTESDDSLKKNSLNDGTSDNGSPFMNGKSLSDKEKYELLAKQHQNGVLDPNENTTQSTAPSTTTNILKEERIDKVDEDFAFLTTSYPVLTVMPYFAPMYTLQNSKNEGQYTTAFGSTAGFNEKPMFSYSTGLLLGYNFSQRLTVFIGCGYNQFSTFTSRDNLQTTSLSPGDSTSGLYSSSGTLGGIQVTVPSNESIPPYLSTESSMSAPITRITQTYGFVEVPVLVRYKFFGQKRVGLTLTGGLSTGFLVRNDVFAENDNERVLTGSTDKIRNFNLNAQVGVGMEVEILPWMYFNFEPTFRYSFLNWSTDDKVKMNPLFFSANTGFSFKF